VPGAVGSAAAVVFPNYGLSPEARYPVALEESYAVLEWVAGAVLVDLARLDLIHGLAALVVMPAGGSPLSIRHRLRTHDCQLRGFDGRSPLVRS
jgi:hypothetical protein